MLKRIILLNFNKKHKFKNLRMRNIINLLNLIFFFEEIDWESVKIKRVGMTRQKQKAGWNYIKFLIFDRIKIHSKLRKNKNFTKVE